MILRRIVLHLKRGDFCDVIKGIVNKLRQDIIYRIFKNNPKNSWKYNYLIENASYKHYKDYMKNDPFLVLKWWYEKYFSPNSKWSKFYDWEYCKSKVVLTTFCGFPPDITWFLGARKKYACDSGLKT